MESQQTQMSVSPMEMLQAMGISPDEIQNVVPPTQSETWPLAAMLAGQQQNRILSTNVE